jgi:hypothetical protein
MKKKSLKRMHLNRETLKRLDRFQAVAAVGTFNCTNLICHTDLCNEGTYSPICANTMENCSADFCETGGACGGTGTCTC